MALKHYDCSNSPVVSRILGPVVPAGNPNWTATGKQVGGKRQVRSIRLRVHALLILLLGLAACAGEQPWLRLDGRSEIRIGFATGPLHFDPHLDSEEATNILCHHLFDPLVFLDSNLKVVPWVATSWQNPDPLTWVFNIRSDIRFHDGTLLTAADVEYSINRIRELPESPKKSLLLSVNTVHALSPNQVEVVTRVPYTPLLGKLSQIMIVPANYYRTKPRDFLRSHPLGSGPYRLVQYRAAEEALLEASPNRWQKAELFRQARFQFVPDDSARTHRLLDGQLDLIRDPDPSLLPIVSQASQLRVMRMPGARLIYLGASWREQLVDGSSNPFRSRVVRQAMSMAINREEGAAHVMDSMAQPAGQLASRLVFGFAPGVQVKPFQPALAGQLLREAQFPSGRVFPCHYPVGKYFHVQQIAEDVARQLSLVGIGLKPAPMEMSAFFKQTHAGRSDLFISGWIPITGDTSDFFEHCFHSRGIDPNYGCYNDVSYDNPVMDQLIEESAGLNERGERLALLQRIMGLAVEELVWIPLYLLDDNYAYRKELQWRPRADRYVLAFQVRTE
ncbi:MAG: ABC transporter substrate-binding protein [Acidobacteriota bacterium]